MADVNGYGTLYLMPVWLGDAGSVEQLPPENIVLAERIDLYFTEHEKTARQMLRRMVPTIELPKLEMHRLDKDTTPDETDRMIDLLRGGRDAAIVSEAGMPGIADPGALLVSVAHRSGVRVVPLIGPSSLVLALAASGLNGQQFTFHGYLPVKPPERKMAIKKLESEAQRTGAAQLFIETPYRNDGLLKDLVEQCAASTSLTIAIDITQPGGSIITRSMGGWKKNIPVLEKRPAVFILGNPTR
ncbi:MAG: SAM-dependent methyltransferase [Flavobacteriales bacterium]|nr:SAM-dependent methyltransferase [Flavobacteriales bacterium]